MTDDPRPHWYYTPEPNGYFEIRGGGLGVGQLLFEDHAQALVDWLNAQPLPERMRKRLRAKPKPTPRALD